MMFVRKVIKIMLNIFLAIALLIFIIMVVVPEHNPNIGDASLNNTPNILPFSLNDNDVTYNSKANPNTNKENLNNPGLADNLRKDILNRAKAMTEIKWTPKYTLIDKYGYYVFVKGKTYYGIPYSMDLNQVVSPDDFLAKMKESKILYGNDCSGFVSAAWGISRQTTLSLYNAVKNGNKIDGRDVSQISWEDLKPGDALLLDNSKGKGHIMLYIDADKKNNDNLNVYEQDIQTIIPFEPIPVARKDIRSKSKMAEEGYIPIRLT